MNEAYNCTVDVDDDTINKYHYNLLTNRRGVCIAAHCRRVFSFCIIESNFGELCEECGKLTMNKKNKE